MADLLAKFRLVDEMSDKLGSMAQSGQSMAEQWVAAGEATNIVFDGMAGAVTAATSFVDGVATSIDNLQEVTDNAAVSADMLAETINNYDNIASEATTQTQYWTQAIGNYDKSLLEAVYTTEELVEMGFKSADVLQEQERMFALCEQSASNLNKSIEATTNIQNELSTAIGKASEVTAELSNNENVSAESKAQLARISAEAAEAMKQLGVAQEEATAAMEAYNTVIISGTTDLEALERAAQKASKAAEVLAEANSKASNTTEELSKATEKVSEEAENGSKKGLNAIEGIAGALAAAGITAKIIEITSAVYDLVTAFSEAESTVVKATGASGEALNDLTTSMMNAYAASKSGSLEDTAGAIGEINTRMLLTGDELTDVTGKFLDYANITGTNVVGSVQNVTKIMKKWGVEGKEVESVLDKLAYAGQISGISVDTLSSNLITGAASFQEMGLSLDNAIYMIAQLELYGMNGTTAITAMRTAVKKFSDDGLNAEIALQSVINEIASMENVADATALAVEVFGSRAGVDMVNAIRSGAITVDKLTGSLEAAQGTLSNTAKTAQTLDQKWTQANNNISTAFTNTLQPVINGISSSMASVMNSFGDILNEHPIFTKILTALGVGLGVVAIGIAAVSAASLKSIPAIAAMGTAINTAIWPITTIAIAIAAVTAAVLIFADTFNDETKGMTATTRAQYYELQNLNAEYEDACEKYGETSKEALRLKYQVDDLSEAFEANKQTVEEFSAEVDTLCGSVSQITSDFNDNIAAIKSSEIGSLALIQKYEELITQTNLEGVQEKELEAITKKLAESYPDLAAQMDAATISAEDYVNAMKNVCQQQAEEQRLQQAQETYTAALQKQAELEEEIAKAEANLNAEREAHGMYYNEQMQRWENGWYTEDSLWASLTTDLDEYNNALNELKAAQAENEATITRIEQDWGKIAEAEEAAAEGTMSWQKSVTIAYQDVKEDIEELCTAYDEVYQSVLESFRGQFGIFDEASMKEEEYTSSTIENAQKALDSQLAYWENYNANIQTLTEYGQSLTGEARESYEALLAYAQDGSEQAAGLANSMAEAIQNGDTDAITVLSNTVAEVSAQQEEAAATTADFVKDFTSQMNEIEEEMKTTIEGMNLSEEAKTSAASTITSYADQIREGKRGAVNAAKEVANAVTIALARSNSTMNVKVNSSSSVPGHAKGTTNAENLFIAGENGPELIARPAAYANGARNSTDYFIAGENGPELIAGQQGSTVFPTNETDRLIAALNNKQQPLQIFADTNIKDNNTTTQEQVKHILLEIGGNGTIEVEGNKGVDKGTILEVLYEHLKPILMNIIQKEIYEEGELSYEY